MKYINKGVCRGVNNEMFQSYVRRSYYEHGDQDVLLGDLGMGEDVLQHRGHVRLVLLSQVYHTFIIRA